MARSNKHGSGQGQLRIIGGQWRGRKLNFTPAPGLRPTGDRIRETLFNWLAPMVHGARCADLFAGSGALGLEALSRGASHCDFVDSSSRAIAELEGHLTTLQASTVGSCHRLQAEQFLRAASEPFDLVFLDPPFAQALVAPICAQLKQRHLLGPGAMIYVETAVAETPPEVPDSWQLHREKSSGGVAYRLFIDGR